MTPQERRTDLGRFAPAFSAGQEGPVCRRRHGAAPPPRRVFIRTLAFVAVLLAAVAARAEDAPSSPEDFGEYEVKAAFMYNFLKFVEWPAPDAGPFTIGVIGNAAQGGLIRKTLDGKSLRGRPLHVHYPINADAAGQCHLLFIGDSSDEETGRVLQQVGQLPVLTVGESDGFAAAGGIVRFTTQQRRVRFQINVGAARTSGLKVSSKLLSLATVVQE